MTRPRTHSLSLVLALACLVAASAAPAAAEAPESAFPRRVLLTNDNGIDDPKLVALARALARSAETWVVAPQDDRSGTGSVFSVYRTGTLTAERRDLGDGIQAFAVDGYPADCVLLALAGLMADRPPDLVISGINGGPNLGSDWFGSGTVGAARTAALGGIPALAVSGLDDDLPGAVAAAVDWVARLASSAAVRDLQPGEYLTASLPRTPPEEILGVRIVDRAPVRVVPRLARFETGDEASGEGGGVWRIVGVTELAGAPADSDQAAYDAGYIAVVPMRVEEVDLERLARWRRAGADLPAWGRAAASPER